MATLSLKNINKIYENRVQAVFNFNLEIKDKEFIVFVGPSGCGKSTTLRMVAGLEDISSGQLYINNKLVNNIDASDRDIAMVFQNYALYPHMTVFNNMSFALRMRKSQMPIYLGDKNIESKEIESKIMLKEMLKSHAKWAAKKNDSELEQKFVESYDKYFAFISEINSKRKQKTGIDKERISALELNVKSITKEIVRLEDLIKKLKEDIAKFESKKSGNNEKDIAKIDEAINQTKTNIQSVNSQIETNKLELESINEEIKYLSSNEVPLCEKRKLTKQEIVNIVFEAAKILDLLPYLLRKPKALSGGQRQRVALGRAIVRKPQVFLMDEPLSNLDAKLRVQTRTEILKITRQIGATTIYVTHDQTEAMTMADRIVVMKDGYIQQIDTPENIYRNPVNTFVAGFIGNPAMNFLTGQIEKENFVIKHDKEIFTLKLNANLKKITKEYEGKEIIMGIRPEQIYLTDTLEQNEYSSPFKLKCDIAELLGNDLIIYTRVCGQSLLCKVNSKNKIDTGSINEYKINMGAVKFFDIETKKAIN